MNVLEKYLVQKGGLTIIISCIDTNIAKTIANNLKDEFNAEVKDITKYMSQKDINVLNKQEMLDYIGKAGVIFIVTPFYPNKFLNLKISYHINISLPFSYINKNKISQNLVDRNIELVKHSFVNKFINYKKFKNVDEIENKVFDSIIKMIMSKLDDGKYLDKIKNISTDIQTTDESSKTYSETSDSETSDSEISDSETSDDKLSNIKKDTDITTDEESSDITLEEDTDITTDEDSSDVTLEEDTDNLSSISNTSLDTTDSDSDYLRSSSEESNELLNKIKFDLDQKRQLNSKIDMKEYNNILSRTIQKKMKI